MDRVDSKAEGSHRDTKEDVDGVDEEGEEDGSAQAPTPLFGSGCHHGDRAAPRSYEYIATIPHGLGKQPLWRK